MPGVREIKLYGIQAGVRQALIDDFHCVFAVNAQVSQSSSIGITQQAGNAGFVDFNTDEVDARVGLRLLE